jgi:hypothetical protein
MTRVIGITFLSIILSTSAWAGEGGGFDSDQPFSQALSERVLQSLFGQALEALDDHFEISGHLDPDSANGDRTKTLQFKFYPEGKSKSRDHITAEGWFAPSQDSHQDEFHFRFSIPKSSAELSPESLNNVL